MPHELHQKGELIWYSKYCALRASNNGCNTYLQQWLFAVVKSFVQANPRTKVLIILQGMVGEVVLSVFFGDLLTP